MAENLCFVVYVDSNAHHGDASERYRAGSHATFEEAVARCREIVDACLAEHGFSGAGLAAYRQWGDDPFIVGPLSAGQSFSAWAYAEERCRERDR